MTTDIHDIIRLAISQMSKTVCINDSTEVVTGEWKLETCNTMWLSVGDNLTVGSDTWVVKEVSINSYFVVTGVTITIPETIDLVLPYYYHGTVMSTNSELNMTKISSDKFPMIYCLEVFREVYNSNPADAIERESSMRLFFLTENNFKNWITEDHYENVINPLRSMLDSFVSGVNDGVGFGKIEDFTTTNHVNFGTFTANEGHLKNLFDDNLSGIELEVTIPIVRDMDCSTKYCAPTPLCLDAIAYNSDNSYSVSIESGNSQLLADVELSVNGISQGMFPSVIDVDLPFVCPTSPCNSLKPTKSGQTISYAAGDDGDIEFGRDDSFFVLSWTNPFGTSERFTDTDGLQVYGNKVVIDWTTYGSTNDEVTGYLTSRNNILTYQFGQSWTNWMANEPYTTTDSSFTGFRVANMLQFQSIWNWDEASMMDYPPFNYSVINSGVRIITSTTQKTLTANTLELTGATYAWVNKGTVRQAILYRQFTLAELGL